MRVHEPKKKTRSVQWMKHFGTECRLNLKMLERNATSLTQLALERQQLRLLQKYWIWRARLWFIKAQPRSRTSNKPFPRFCSCQIFLRGPRQKFSTTKFQFRHSECFQRRYPPLWTKQMSLSVKTMRTHASMPASQNPWISVSAFGERTKRGNDAWSIYPKLLNIA